MWALDVAYCMAPELSWRDDPGLMACIVCGHPLFNLFLISLYALTYLTSDTMDPAGHASEVWERQASACYGLGN